ncbi:nuclease-related domain-containing protein [Fundicoccus culcitae]|uniref:NERD domain-containing protein n=1 Tax=Fundicoccus culcitae TaxID=2969821 RepID=A0ABY5P7I3_9LACT|nr:nuclease-related domain-containing protein [Fundicoccus culcitae]UUX34691.1 NERD domain-containing protein [Fundicoccus culcitae]
MTGMIKAQEFQWLEEMEVRGVLDKEENTEIFIKRMGFEGEEEAYGLLSLYKNPEWRLLRDLRYVLQAGEIQVDLLLITQLGWLVFEVKNYDAEYRYVDGVWSVNGTVKMKDDFKQLKRMLDIFAGVHRSCGSGGELSGKLLFINESDSVDIEGVDASLYLKRAKLKRFIQGLSNECQHLFVDDSSMDYDAEWLLARSVEDPRRKSLTQERYSKLKKGVYCDSCKSFNTKFQRYHLKCHECGYSESSEKAILRTICAYGVLFPFRALKTSEVLTLFGGQVKYVRVKTVLMKFFEYDSTTLLFKNPVNSYEYQFPQYKPYYRDKNVIK